MNTLIREALYDLMVKMYAMQERGSEFGLIAWRLQQMSFFL